MLPKRISGARYQSVTTCEGKETASFRVAECSGDVASAVLRLPSVLQYLVGVGAQGHPEGSSQSEVSQLDGAQLIDEQILGLQVSVDDPMRVAEIHPLQQLEEVALPSERKEEPGEREAGWRSGAFAGLPRPSLATLTKCRGSSEAGAESMYFFRSWLRNSNTR